MCRVPGPLAIALFSTLVLSITRLLFLLMGRKLLLMWAGTGRSMLTSRTISHPVGAMSCAFFSRIFKLRLTLYCRLVFVYDPTDKDQVQVPIGKQTLNPSHIFYTPCSGIWQTVWIESAPAAHVTQLDVSADMNGKGSTRLSDLYSTILTRTSERYSPHQRKRQRTCGDHSLRAAFYKC